jgi:serine/threonine protein kinase
MINRRPKEWRGGAKYNKSRVIGKGAFATVYMITAKYDGTVYAAKELEKRRFVKNGILDQKVDQEMRIMSSIRHVSPPSMIAASIGDSNPPSAKYCSIY